VVLMGERIHRAREVLKPYKNGTFTRWLSSTFGTRKTGYNTLSYFELYRDLPQERLKEQFKKIPLKAAYILASREGNIDAKANIIREYHSYDYNDLVALIQEKLPIPHSNKQAKKSLTSMLIDQMQKTAQNLGNIRKDLTEEDREALQKVKVLVDSLIKIDV